MAKSEGDARSRLQQAALDLFREKGYEQTTAAEIAARAGVTERTFFRQFPDKREVLFDGEPILRAALVEAIAAVPPASGPLDTLFHAFHGVQTLLEGNRPFAKPRHDIIFSTPALYERELAKLAALTDALAEALVARGVGGLQAVLAARTGMAAFVHATVAWLEDDSIGLGRRLDDAYRELKAMCA
ncbi:TetR/AcrR family transcriptional regulator [Massilia sp. 9096]|uniref:TetR/AcrR family transcriptional regulator n=1 Tax=Massilia sp. 9096 TaxID=1500894 RepID=UPI00056C09D9|nr:TetR/AcrR family transcriptional regulator [Massilia sp. 9096]